MVFYRAWNHRGMGLMGIDPTWWDMVMAPLMGWKYLPLDYRRTNLFNTKTRRSALKHFILGVVYIYIVYIYINTRVCVCVEYLNLKKLSNTSKWPKKHQPSTTPSHQPSFDIKQNQATLCSPPCAPVPCKYSIHLHGHCACRQWERSASN